MRFPLCLLAALSLLAGCAGWTVHPVRVAEVSARGAARLLSWGGGVAVDVSPAADYAAGHIPGALGIPYSQLWAMMGKLGDDPALPVVVYDSDESRSFQAALLLKTEGYDRVLHLSGGLAAWKAAGLPVARGGAEP